MARAKAAEAAAKKPGPKAAATKRLFGYSGPKVQGPKSPRKVGSWKVSRPSGTAAPPVAAQRAQDRRRREQEQRERRDDLLKKTRPKSTAPRPRQLPKSSDGLGMSFQDRAKWKAASNPKAFSDLAKKHNREALVRKAKRNQAKRRGFIGPPNSDGSYKSPKKTGRALLRKVRDKEEARKRRGAYKHRYSGPKKTTGKVVPQDPVGARRYKPRPVSPEFLRAAMGPKTKVQAENDGRSQVIGRSGSFRNAAGDVVAVGGSSLGGAVPLSRLPKESGGSKPEYQGPQRGAPRSKKKPKKLPLAPQQSAPGRRRIGPLTKEQSEQVQRNRAAARKRLAARLAAEGKKEPKPKPPTASEKLARWKQRNRELDAYEAEKGDGFSKPLDGRADYNSDDGKSAGKTEKPISFDDADRGDVRKIQDDKGIDTQHESNVRDKENDTPKQSGETSKKIKRQRAAKATRDDIKGVPRLIGGDKDADARARLKARYLDRARDKSLTQTEINRRKKREGKLLSRSSYFSDQAKAPPKLSKEQIKAFDEAIARERARYLEKTPGAMPWSPTEVRSRVISRPAQEMGEADYKEATGKRQELVADIDENGKYPAGTIQRGLKPGDIVRLPDGSSGKLVSTGTDPKTNRAIATVKQSRSTGKAAKANLLSGSTLKNKVLAKGYKRKQAKLRQETVTRTGDLRNLRPAGGQPASVTKQGSPRGVPWSYAKTVILRQHGGDDGKSGPQRLSKEQIKALDEATARERARYFKKTPGAMPWSPIAARFPAAVMSMDNPINDGPVIFPSTGKEQYKASGSFGSYAKAHGSGVTAVWDKSEQKLFAEDAGGHPDAGHPFKSDPAATVTSNSAKGGKKHAAAAARGGSTKPGGRGSLNTQLKTDPKSKPREVKAQPRKARKYSPRQAAIIARGLRAGGRGRGAELNKDEKQRLVRGLRADQGIGVQKASSARGAGITRKANAGAQALGGAALPLTAYTAIKSKDKGEKAVASGDTAAMLASFTKYGKWIGRGGGAPLTAAMLFADGVVSKKQKQKLMAELNRSPEGRRFLAQESLKKRLQDQNNADRFAKGKAPRYRQPKFGPNSKVTSDFYKKKREIGL